MTKLISFSEAIAILETCDENGVPVPFSIEFCKADRERGSAGEIIRYEKAIWHIKNGRKSSVDAPVDKRKTGPKPKNWIRKIRGFDTDQIRNVNVQLILTINGLSVR